MQKSLRRSNNTFYNNSLDGLQNALGSFALDGVPVSPHRDDERVLLVALQRLYRTLFRAERFKVWFTRSTSREWLLTDTPSPLRLTPDQMTPYTVLIIVLHHQIRFLNMKIRLCLWPWMNPLSWICSQNSSLPKTQKTWFVIIFCPPLV